MTLDDAQDDAVAIAAAHHDIALWTDDRIDYLDPSWDHALAWLEREGRTELSDVVSDMIVYHHKITTGAFARMDPLALAFRNADWSALHLRPDPVQSFHGASQGDREGVSRRGFSRLSRPSHAAASAQRRPLQPHADDEVVRQPRSEARRGELTGALIEASTLASAALS